MATAGRFEYKYSIPAAEAERLRAALTPYCQPDANLSPGEDDYIITSIYFDSPSLTFYWEKRALKYARTKVRIRTYGDTCNGPVFFEIKRRFGDVIAKSRARVPQDRWPELLCADVGDIASFGLKPKAMRVYEDFYSLSMLYALRPVAAIRYNRIPYVGRLDSGVRVTFDFALRCVPLSDPIFPTRDGDYHYMDFSEQFQRAGSLVIVEIKFTDHFPRWLAALAAQFNLWRGAFSKYTAAIDDQLSERYTYDGQRRGLMME